MRPYIPKPTAYLPSPISSTHTSPKNSVEGSTERVWTRVGTACRPGDAIRRAECAGGAVWRKREPEDLIARQTPVHGNRPPLAGKRGLTRLGLALMLTFFEPEVRLPRPARRHLHQRQEG